MLLSAVSFLLTQLLIVSAETNAQRLRRETDGSFVSSAATPGSGTWALSDAPIDFEYTSFVSSNSGQYLVGCANLDTNTRSNDYGATWISNYEGTLPVLAVSDSSGQIINGVDDISIYRSTDYGASYTTMSRPLSSTNAMAWTVIATDRTGTIVYLVSKGSYTTGAETKGIFTSTDGMATWGANANPSDLVLTIACSGDGQFALYYQTSKLYRTTNTGATWSAVNNVPFVSYTTYAQLVFATDSLYVYALIGFSVYRSPDAGLNWVQASVLAEKLVKLASDATGQYLVMCTTVSVYISSTFGDSWVKSLTTDLVCSAVSSDSTGMFLSAAFPPSTTKYGGVYTRNAIPLPTLSPTFSPTRPTAVPTVAPSTPTSQPSSQPSSAPSCILGSTHTGEESGACVPCVPGEYISELGGVCLKCPKGTYTSSRGAAACDECPFPTTSVFEGQTECTGYSVYESNFELGVILGALAVITLLPILSMEKRFVVLVNLLFPALDVFSDMAYLLGNDFYSPILFYICLLFIALPVVFFIRVLVKEGAPPCVHYDIRESLWLTAGRDGDAFYYAVFPCFTDGRLPVISCKTHGNLALVLLEGFVWVIAVLAQVFSPLVWLVFAVLHAFFLVFWLFLGAFFYLTKTITIGRVWNFWFRVWAGSNDHETDVDVDTHALNTCLQHEFYFETLPQVAIQLANTFLLRQLSLLAIVSLSLSFAMAINGLYKYIYYRWLTDTSMKVEDIPIDMSLHVKIECLGIDWLLFEGKLQPMRRTRSGKMSKKDDGYDTVDGVEMSAVESYENNPTNPSVAFSVWLCDALSNGAANTLSNAQVQHCAKCFTTEGFYEKEQWLAVPMSARYLKYLGITNTATQAQVLQVHAAQKQRVSRA